MRDQDHFTPPLDLTRYTEATRRALYDATVAVHFPPADQAEPGEWVPSYSPDDAGLTVVFQWDRWFAVWERIEERDNPELPRNRKLEVLRIEAEPSMPHGVMFYEI